MGALCAFLLIAIYYDEKYRRIPNVLLLAMLVVGLIRRIYFHGAGGMLAFLLAAAFLMILLYPFFKIGALGAGDLKLFGVCSGYLSRDKILHFLFFSLLVAAIFSVVKLIVERNAKERLCYLVEYMLEVTRSGKWSLYIRNKEDAYKVSIPLASSVFASVLLYLGGVY